MARPTKQGLDYFPLDTQFDDKTELYLNEKEGVGLAVLVTLWQLIYHNEGYYIVNNKDLHLLIKRRINVNINPINECINLCLSRSIFNHNLHQKYKILTSRAIQKRYFDAAKRKKVVYYDKLYIINGVNVSKNAIMVLHQSLNVNVNVKGDVEEGKKPKSLTPLQILWNQECKNLNKVIETDDKREELERLRLQERPLSAWKEVFVAINNSLFCRGENDRAWTADYDWIIKGKEFAIRALEGKYDDGNAVNWIDEP